MDNARRPLGTFERFLWFHNQIEPVHFSVSALVEGATTVDEWKSALSALQNRHPLLRVSIPADANGVPYFRNEPKMPIPLRVVEGSALGRLEIEIAKEIATPFHSSTAPLIRAVLLHEEQRSIVILVAHHSIVDAISLTYAIRDLLQSLSGKALEPLPIPPSHEELLGISENMEENGCETAGTIASINTEFFKLVPSVISLRMPVELTSSLKARAQQERTSIHGALAASIVFAARELGINRKQGSLRLGSPISTRKLLNQGEACALLTDIGMLDLEFSASGDFWELARYVRTELSPQQSLNRLAKSRRELQEVLADVCDAQTIIQIARQEMNTDFVLSNMGNLSVESQYGRLRLEAVWGPAILIGTFKNQQVIGVATVNGGLSLLYCSHAPIPHLLETMKDMLIEAC